MQANLTNQEILSNIQRHVFSVLLADFVVKINVVRGVEVNPHTGQLEIWTQTFPDFPDARYRAHVFCGGSRVLAFLLNKKLPLIKDVDVCIFFTDLLQTRFVPPSVALPRSKCWGLVWQQYGNNFQCRTQIDGVSVDLNCPCLDGPEGVFQPPLKPSALWTDVMPNPLLLNTLQQRGFDVVWGDLARLTWRYYPKTPLALHPHFASQPDISGRLAFVLKAALEYSERFGLSQKPLSDTLYTMAKDPLRAPIIISGFLRYLLKFHPALKPADPSYYSLLYVSSHSFAQVTSGQTISLALLNVALSTCLDLGRSPSDMVSFVKRLEALENIHDLKRQVLRGFCDLLLKRTPAACEQVRQLLSALKLLFPASGDKQLFDELICALSRATRSRHPVQPRPTQPQTLAITRKEATPVMPVARVCNGVAKHGSPLTPLGSGNSVSFVVTANPSVKQQPPNKSARYTINNKQHIPNGDVSTPAERPTRNGVEPAHSGRRRKRGKKPVHEGASPVSNRRVTTPDMSAIQAKKPVKPIVRKAIMPKPPNQRHNGSVLVSKWRTLQHTWAVLSLCGRIRWRVVLPATMGFMRRAVNSFVTTLWVGVFFNVARDSMLMFFLKYLLLPVVLSLEFYRINKDYCVLCKQIKSYKTLQNIDAQSGRLITQQVYALSKQHLSHADESKKIIQKMIRNAGILLAVTACFMMAHHHTNMHRIDKMRIFGSLFIFLTLQIISEVMCWLENVLHLISEVMCWLENVLHLKVFKSMGKSPFIEVSEHRAALHRFQKI